MIILKFNIAAETEIWGKIKKFEQKWDTYKGYKNISVFLPVNKFLQFINEIHHL